ncbi:transmembrane protein, putative (macronuclear) [Tetrahymena thermophila SB210]|uniref:Transmembrane protein, putative n=1 Tax=Tetrahymena thermophila (strain SB210) TaxID=312017 RepID=Q245B3_TETTS|nr:transmembrane protein, putative [Tetrahymena thermophila SB210]EAS03324.2 transmembrane protein, putative [Tetrahymena thermophila SB210]|eukprot:XP_001023569.2 transmembrane protein, putative [Tetrahymena thermophila SB210]
MIKQIKLQLKLGLYGLVFAISSIVIASLFQNGFDCNKGLVKGYIKNNFDNQHDPIIKKNYIIFIESLPLEWLFQNIRLLYKSQHQFHYDLLKKVGFEESFLLNSTLQKDQKDQNINKTSNFFVQELKPSNSISNQDLVIEFLLGVSMQNLVSSNYNDVQFFQNFDSLLNQIQSSNKTCQYEDISFSSIQLSEQRYKITEMFQNFCSYDDLLSQEESILDQNIEFYYSGSSISQQADITSDQFKDEINYLIQQIQKIKNKVQKDELLTIISLYQRNSYSKNLCVESKSCVGFSLQYSPSFELRNIEFSIKEKVKIPDISATISLISGIMIPLLSQGRYLNTFLNSYIKLSNKKILELNANYQKINLQQLSQYYEKVQQNSYIFNDYTTLYEKIQTAMRIEDQKYFIQESQNLIDQLVNEEFKKINPFQTQLLSVSTMIMIILVIFIWSCLIYFNSKLQQINIKNYGVANLINQTDLVLDKDDRVRVQILVNTFLQALYFLGYFIQQISFLNSQKCIFLNPNSQRYLYQETIRDQFLLFICFLSIISLQASFFTYVQQIQEAKRYLYLTLYLAIISALFFVSVDEKIQEIIQINSIVTLLEQNVFYCGIQLYKYYFVYKIGIAYAQNSSRTKKLIKIICFILQDLLFFVPQIIEMLFKISIQINTPISFIINIIIFTVIFYLIEKSNFQSTLIILCFNCINFICQTQFIQDSSQKLEYLFCYTTFMIIFLLIINQLNILSSISALIGVYMIKNIFFCQIFRCSYVNQYILSFNSSSLQQICFLLTEITIIAILSMMAQLRDEVKQKYGIIFFLKSQILELRFIYDILKYIIFYFIHLVILQINILTQIDRNEHMSKNIYPKISTYEKLSFSYQIIVIASILLILIQIYSRKKYFMYRATKSEIMKTDEERIETNQQITLQDI